MNRLREQHGFAVPLALSVIAIIAGFSAVAIALATHNVDRSSRDRLAVRAAAAADAGLDAAAYRLNKSLVASKIEGLVPGGLVALTTEVVGCLELGVGEMVVAHVEVNGCAATAAETVDETVNDDGLGPAATYRYWIKTGVNVVVEGRELVERQIVVVGQAGGVVHRVLGRYGIDAALPATTLFSRAAYIECTATVPAAGTDPTEGC